MVRRQLFNIVLLGLVLFAIAFAAAPWFAFRALKANARDQDVAGLSELVDFRALRTSLRAQVRAPEPEPAAAPDARPDIWRDPLGAMRRALEPLAEPLAPLTAPPGRSGGYVAPRTCLIVPGFGFAEEELDHIFDAGFRCERAAALCFLCGGLAYAERSSHTWLLFPATTNLSWDNLCRIVPTN